MRKRLSADARRADILDTAARQFAARGYGATEMEHIRTACGISRGGLYHHFGSRRAILDALIVREVAALAEVVENDGGNPVAAVIHAGSMHLGGSAGVLAAMHGRDERLEYLSSLEEAFARQLAPPLARALAGTLADGVDTEDAAELFLAIATELNRREILQDWTAARARRFGATALRAFATLLRDPGELEPVIAALDERGRKA